MLTSLCYATPALYVHPTYITLLSLPISDTLIRLAACHFLCRALSNADVVVFVLVSLAEPHFHPACFSLVKCKMKGFIKALEL